MKKQKLFGIVCSLVLLLCLIVPMTVASAAYVTDGDKLYVAGDTMADGTIDVCDLVAAQKGLGATAAADLDGDGTVGSYDLALIRAMILGIDKSEWTE